MFKLADFHRLRVIAYIYTLFEFFFALVVVKKLHGFDAQTLFFFVKI